MKAKTLYFALILTVFVSLNSALAIPGATVPWITYEAENGTYTGALRGPSYAGNSVESESSGRQCVRLTNGQYVAFTAVSNATAIVVRYSVPDTSDGVGADYTLGLYKGTNLVGRLPVTSKYSWLYGNYPFSNTPSQGSPRNFFDEVRTNGVSIVAGDVIKLQKDAADGSASYYDIDLIDLENVPAAITQPGGFASVTGYGADTNGVNDSTSAFNNCIINNSNVWISPGTYKITGTINCIGNRTIRGAGMWYSTLVGDASLYGTASRRVILFGNGSNIKLSDFAIVGKLNYRNDNEANDGLGGGGKFDGSSVISNIWVEHTKTGGWIINSQSLTVNSCRFRNTIADGINLSMGMRSCTVTNCTARGTGDDCFALWPANYGSGPLYLPGLNVITRCTAQTSFLAQGGAIYGGDSNRIEDCLFQDIPYECGVLLSTTFPVSTNFSGTTVVQRCDVNRCGGTRAGVQIYMENRGISGLNLNNLNISNSAGYALSIVRGAGGGLANAIMYNSTIPNYGLAGGGYHGMYAASNAVGSLTVSNCVVSEYFDEPSNSFTFNFVTTTVPVTVQTSPTGRSFTVDGTNYTATQVLNWIPGSSHTIATTSPQSGGTGTQYVWSSWSDGGAMSHTVAPTASTNYTANFTTQYYLTVNTGTGGSVSPTSDWYESGTNVSISATASNGYTFGTWTGTGSGSYSGTNNPASVAINGPVTQMAAFDVLPEILGITVSGDESVTISYATIPGYSYHVETTTNLSLSAWTTVPGSETNAAGSAIIFIDPNAVGDPQRFYRIGSP